SDCGASPGWAPARPRRWPPSSTTRNASARPRRSAGTSGWSRARTSRATAIGWGPSPARGRRGAAPRAPRRPGPPRGGRRPARAAVGPLVAEATWPAVRRSPTVRADCERVRRADPQRRKIALVATAHDLVRVMWALLKHGTTWEEGVAPAEEPKGAAPAIVNV